LYRTLTARENLRFFAELRGTPDAADRIVEVGARVGVSEFLDRPVGQLSRGQGQRVALARALLNDPEVLLLDEPFTGLDPAGGEAVDRTLSELRSRGRVIIVVTHDVPRGLRLSDHAVVLRRGSKVLDEAAADCTVGRINDHFGSQSSREAPVVGAGTAAQ
ncbi:MAG: ATP-binding cassette domain-containing protein, partial [Longimicrobiales bacterium]